MKQLLMAVFLFSSLASCKKDDDDKPECTLNVSSVSGTYTISSYLYKESSSSPEVDQMPDTEPCERDDTFTFNSNGQYLFEDAGVLCDGPESVDGSWSLSGNNLILDDETVPVKKFDCKQLVLEFHDTYVTGDRSTLTFNKR
ncbi:lipocalin family protein [Flavihumibacter petaseus]|uniref:Lipocalin-like domain-containing protein n=1 Tax=Flavihumibacter petaseus NBRC 106054 TaxID=1220578 RepID=A0A0E9MYZ6_9BACT|nr:lipocalin family protein [Flavihumibacter petaseus]GAO42626.1 hypothetical protein FPE01S_01_16410 [Flavihumibacter petaseus NBRC 106054]